ncbi:MAG: cytochrome P460 family protein [Flavobacteriales bacterium]
MNKKLPIFLVGLIAIYALGCRHDRDTSQQDTLLYEEAQNQAIYYFADSAMLPGISPSPHGFFRLRYNQIFRDFLDDMENVPLAESVPNGSLIVKDIYSGDQIIQVAIMKKDDAHPDAGSGWIWAEILPDGRTLVSSTDKGAACIGCHSTVPNSDLTKTFDLH